MNIGDFADHSSFANRPDGLEKKDVALIERNRTFECERLVSSVPKHSPNTTVQPFVVPARKCRISAIGGTHWLDSHKLSSSVTPESPGLLTRNNKPNP